MTSASFNRITRRAGTSCRRLIVLSVLVLTTSVLAQAQASKITSSPGHYSIIFPAPVQREISPPKTVNGLTFSLEQYSAVVNSQVFMSLFTSYTGGVVNTKAELELNVQNFIKGIEGELLSSKPAQYVSPASRRVEGVEFTAQAKDITCHGKFFVSGNDVWGILYVARKGYESPVVKEQFFRSFEIN